MEWKTLEGTSKLVSHGWKHKAEKSVGSRFESPQLKSSSINILIPTQVRRLQNCTRIENSQFFCFKHRIIQDNKITSAIIILLLWLFAEASYLPRTGFFLEIQGSSVLIVPMPHLGWTWQQRQPRTYYKIAKSPDQRAKCSDMTGAVVWEQGVTWRAFPAQHQGYTQHHPPQTSPCILLKQAYSQKKPADICTEAHHLGSPDAVTEVLQGTVHVVINQVSPASNRGAEGNAAGGLVQT